MSFTFDAFTSIDRLESLLPEIDEYTNHFKPKAPYKQSGQTLFM